jgi:hypothetical protein
MAYSSTISDAKYSRLETEHDQIKSELTLNPGMKLYKTEHPERGTYRMILPESVEGVYLTANAIKYWDFKPDSITSYSLASKELVIEDIQL